MALIPDTSGLAPCGNESSWQAAEIPKAQRRGGTGAAQAFLGGSFLQPSLRGSQKDMKPSSIPGSAGPALHPYIFHMAIVLQAGKSRSYLTEVCLSPLQLCKPFLKHL